jgi:hypothetical protein
MTAQLGSQHSRQRNDAISAGFGFFLAAAGFSLLNAGDDAKLPRFEIDGFPTQRRDLTAP